MPVYLRSFRLRGLARGALLALALLGVAALAACTQPATPDSAAPPTEPPLIPATAPSPDQAAAVSDFASQHAAIVEEWNLLHDDFDQWSAGLSACHPNAMHLALNELAVSFNSVTQGARALSRGTTSSELADLLIAAAEAEEAAFRQLRDRWQPNNSTLFENVELQRAKSSQAQKDAEDRAIELRDGLQDAADPEQIAAFLEVFEALSEAWKKLGDNYETLRDGADDMELAAVAKGLEEHVAGLKSIADAISELPELEGAEDAVELLTSAAKAESEAFSDIVDSLAKDQAAKTTSAAQSDDASSDDADADAESGAAADASTATASASADAQLPDFDPLDHAVEASAAALKQASRAIDGLADPDAERTLAELQTFDTEYQSLLASWLSFHQAYNDWRMDDGGCDRAQVIADLDQYALRITLLARDVRGLPSSGYLLPIYSLLTEAAARDENAFRTLSYTWQPFTLDSLKAVHQERINTDNLRREAEIAVQELKNRS